MQEKVSCKNIFKSQDSAKRTEAFTKKWIEIINQAIKNNDSIFKK